MKQYKNLTRSLQSFFSTMKTKNQKYRDSKLKRQQQKQEFIYGLNSVQAALHSKRRKIFQLYISDSQVIQLNSKTMKLINFAKSNDIPLVYTPKFKLDRLVNNAPHQNVVLKCTGLDFSIIISDNIPIFNQGIYVYTDKITDPQNFGAIIRSSLFFGVNHIFSSKKNHCPLNPTVSKASTGAVQLIDISLIQKSQQFLQKWKQQQGFILSTEVNDMNKKIYPVQQLQDLKKQDNLQKILIILGSEGFGVSNHLRKYSDYNIMIERKGNNSYPYSLIDSLNVNSALSAILFEITKDKVI